MTKWWQSSSGKESSEGGAASDGGYKQTKRFGSKPGDDGYDLRTGALRNDPQFQTPEEKEFIENWIHQDLQAAQDWQVVVSRLNADKDLFPREPTISTHDRNSQNVAARFLSETSGNTNGVGSSRSSNGRATVHDGWNTRTGQHDFIITELRPDKVDKVSGQVIHYAKTTRKLDPTDFDDAKIIARHNADQIRDY